MHSGFLTGAALQSCVRRQGCSPAGSGLPECKSNCSIDCFDACLSNFSRTVWQQLHFFRKKHRVAFVLSTGSSVRKVNSHHGSDLKLVTQQVLAILLQYTGCSVVSLSRNTMPASCFEKLHHICFFTHLVFALCPCKLGKNVFSHQQEQITFF